MTSAANTMTEENGHDRRKLVSISIGSYHFEIRSAIGGLILVLLVMLVIGAGIFYVSHQDGTVTMNDHARALEAHDNITAARFERLTWMTCITHKSQDWCSAVGVYMPDMKF